MIEIIKTDGINEDFRALVVYLDQTLAETDGDEHDFYHQFNGIDNIRYVLVAYIGGAAVGCGAIKKYNDDAVEVKRMYVQPMYRGRGIASQILNKLENWAATLGFKYCILETGKRQHDAIALYQKCNYEVMPNYGQYENVENSVCMKKKV
jgi:putative acetyltransferase